MVENIPMETLNDLLSSFIWASTIPNGLHIEAGELLRQQLHAQVAQMQLQMPQLAQQILVVPPQLPVIETPTVQVSPSTASPSSTASPPIKSKSSPKRQNRNRAMSPLRGYELNRNTYSDCEKRHFLDVAFENNWGTTVAANKFIRVWEKGPSRRMFYWWREQFKKEHLREQSILEDLRNRKLELANELAELTKDSKLFADRAQQCAHQIDAVDSEISVLISKRQKKAFCSITGEPCAHGDGLEVEGTKKFATPFHCDFCKMPFQKKSTCHLHMRLCQSRYVPRASEVKEVKAPSSPFINVDLIQNNSNTELTELTEYLIGRIAAAPEYLTQPV